MIRNFYSLAGGFFTSANEHPPPTAASSCSPKVRCNSNEYNFEIISGGGVEAKPYICLNNVSLVNESLSNYGRGMNVVLVDGRNGQFVKSFVFDVFSQTSMMFINFLRTIEDEHVVLITTYDDASKNLNAAARFELISLGSRLINELHHRDAEHHREGQPVAPHLDEFLSDHRAEAGGRKSSSHRVNRNCRMRIASCG